MTIVFNNSFIADAALEWIMLQASHVYICSAEPTDYEEAVSTYALAFGTASITGPFDLLESDVVIGRYIVIEVSGELEVVAEDTASHVALVGGGSLIAAYECTGSELEIEEDSEVIVEPWCMSVLFPTELDICTIP